jgi:hypothetical protein
MFALPPALRGAGVEEEREFGHGECYLAALPVAKRKWAKADAGRYFPVASGSAQGFASFPGHAADEVVVAAKQAVEGWQEAGDEGKIGNFD